MRRREISRIDIHLVIVVEGIVHRVFVIEAGRHVVVEHEVGLRIRRKRVSRPLIVVEGRWNEWIVRVKGRLGRTGRRCQRRCWEGWGGIVELGRGEGRGDCGGIQANTGDGVVVRLVRRGRRTYVVFASRERGSTPVLTGVHLVDILHSNAAVALVGQTAWAVRRWV
jgi:hypothetical protein